MPKLENYRKHEVQFCAEVSKFLDKYFGLHPELPFGSSDIESFSKSTRKRNDLRIYDRKGDLALCAEVKLPGTPHGGTPFDPALVEDASSKADREACRYYFTWNVEHLALFDRSLYDRQFYERCIGQWLLGIRLDRPTDVTRPDVLGKLFNDLLPSFTRDFAEIYEGRRRDFALPLSDLYITVLESHLAGPMGPVRQLRDYLLSECDRSKRFETEFRLWLGQQQWSYDRNDSRSWAEIADRAARSMVYVLSNRILFYQAVRGRNKLPKLDLPSGAKTPKQALEHLRKRFNEAVFATGDYEPVFFPDDSPEEWAARSALSGVNAIDSWAKVIRAVERFNFSEIPSDVLGGVFQKLIGPEERHKFGQHYTDENIIDVINAFCIRDGDARVFDPACGSGGFLVRSYYRKAQLDDRLTHHDLIESLYGCDINPFPAHLATLNMAARNITNQENYPRIVRKNFFKVSRENPFCELPKATRGEDGEREREKIFLPELDSIVGNPPYVRQELIPKAEKGVVRDQTKEYLQEVVERAWPGIDLSRQSDLHVYFWPAAATFLREGGWFGFLTSSSWLDVRYGFPLQRWVLLNFELVAVIESVHEPWFEDARVKTAVTILRRCSDAKKRDTNLVRFVRVQCPLAEILGERGDELQRQDAAERFRDLILRTKADDPTPQLRIMVKKQADLWKEGLDIAEMFARQRQLTGDSLKATEEEDSNSDDDFESLESETVLTLDYGGGKWGRYLRAPDFYFEIMREFGSRFVRLGEIATIKRGITSGCDAFFMPRDVTARVLEDYPDEPAWRSLPLIPVSCKRYEVAKGRVAIIECGDRSLHAIERRFIRAEVHSLMQVDRPIVTAGQLDRVVLWVSEPLEEIQGTLAWHYIRWGAKQTFASRSNKSKSVPLPERDTCKGRNPWYDLTGLTPGVGFWPKSQQYRHIVPANPNDLNCNCNLYDIHLLSNDDLVERSFMPILNSTLVGLFKAFYGRYAGTEGNLKTEVVDAFLIEIPNPHLANKKIAEKLQSALSSMQGREVTELLEDSLRECHTAEEVREAEKLPISLPFELRQADRRELDDAVFELLGVGDARRRGKLIDQLYEEITRHTRTIRVMEVQKMEQRRQSGRGAEASALDLAADAWAAAAPEWQQSLADWLREQIAHGKAVAIPEGPARLPAAGHFFDSTTIYFGKNSTASYVAASRAEAELLHAITEAGLHGEITVPISEKECVELAAELRDRLAVVREQFESLAAERAGTDRLRHQVVDLLYSWSIHGSDSEIRSKAEAAK